MEQIDSTVLVSQKTEKTEHASSGIRIISIVGFQGSGKSTLGKGLAKYLNAPHVEVSETVRLASGYSTKAELASTAQRTESNPDWLGELVEQHIHHSIGDERLVVLTGVREPAVHQYLYRRGALLWAFELYCDAPIRYNRLCKLSKVSNGYEFLEQELREIKMGLREVMREAAFFVKTSDDTKPKKIVLKMAAKLEEEEAI